MSAETYTFTVQVSRGTYRQLERLLPVLKRKEVKLPNGQPIVTVDDVATYVLWKQIERELSRC